MHKQQTSGFMFVALSLSLASSVPLSGPSFADDHSDDTTLGKKVYFSRCIACHEPPSRVGLTPEEIAMNEAELAADALEATPTRGPSLTG